MFLLDLPFGILLLIAAMAVVPILVQYDRFRLWAGI